MAMVRSLMWTSNVIILLACVCLEPDGMQRTTRYGVLDTGNGPIEWGMDMQDISCQLRTGSRSGGDLHRLQRYQIGASVLLCWPAMLTPVASLDTFEVLSIRQSLLQACRSISASYPSSSFMGSGIKIILKACHESKGSRQGRLTNTPTYWYSKLSIYKWKNQGLVMATAYSAETTGGILAERAEACCRLRCHHLGETPCRRLQGTRFWILTFSVYSADNIRNIRYHVFLHSKIREVHLMSNDMLFEGFSICGWLLLSLSYCNSEPARIYSFFSAVGHVIYLIAISVINLIHLTQ